MLKLKIIGIALIGVLPLCGQQYADPSKYLVDSLPLTSISEQDKHALDSLLPIYHRAQSDTGRLSILNKIIETSIGDDVWPLYNQLLYDQSREVLSNPMLSKQEKNFVKKCMAAAINNYGYLAYNSGQPDQAINYYKQSLKYYQELLDKDGMATCFNNLAALFDDQGMQAEALKYYNQSLQFAEQIDDKQSIAFALNNIGYIYNDQGQIQKALEYYRKCVKIQEEINDKQTLAITLNNIGYIYKMQGQDEQCLDYYKRSIKIFEEIGDQQGLAGMYNNMGIIYNQHPETYDLALDYYEKSLKIEREINHQKGIADALNNIGVVFENKGATADALARYEESLKIREQINEKEGMASSYLSIGRLNNNIGQIEEGIRYGLKSLALAEEIASPYNMQKAAEFLYQVYDKKHDLVNGYKMYKLHIEMRDSLLNEANKKAAIKDDIQYQFQKQALKDSLERAEVQKLKDLEHTREIEQQKTYVVIGIAACVVLVLIVMVVLRGYQQKRKTNAELEEKNEVIEQKNHEITDSINYAKRIQQAIVPSKNELNQQLGDCFVLYRPKDIVAGDFYWLQQVGDEVLYAVADCTGHGVPGAMVSVVCNNALNRAIKEFRLQEPAGILDKTRELVKETFLRDGEDEKMIKDGMDIALCAINFKTQTLKYAGANNPLWIIRPTVNCHPEPSRGDFMDDSKNTELEDYLSQTTDNYLLYEIKPDKQPVGKHHQETPFTGHEVILLPGDRIYTFSDGFPDQFGGPKGKKYMYKRFKETLLEVADLPMSQQALKLDELFDNWRGQIEQIDDVCILGVMI
ncbi:MAG: tetratricopeptide repeat protein [Flavobacteriales bacterium]|nr:tetratricopeptide repeat protein [Flavobacteriales bacterium]